MSIGAVFRRARWWTLDQFDYSTWDLLESTSRRLIDNLWLRILADGRRFLSLSLEQQLLRHDEPSPSDESLRPPDRWPNPSSTLSAVSDEAPLGPVPLCCATRLDSPARLTGRWGLTACLTRLFTAP